MTGDSYLKATAYNTSLELAALAPSHIQAKTLNGTAFQPTISLRFKSDSLIIILKMQSLIYSKRCFGKDAATLWDNLPLTIKNCKTLSTFKKKVKTDLFITAYSM